MSKRNAVQFVQNDEPAFIRQFKQKVGYKEGPDVDTKRQRLEYEEDEDRPEAEDEKPVVVVLKSGDLTETEADELTKAIQKQEEEQAIRDGKITFKKPVKKEDDSSTDNSASDETKGSAKSQSGKSKDKKKKEKEKKTSNLLSFGDEEEEEDG